MKQQAADAQADAREFVVQSRAKAAEASSLLGNKNPFNVLTTSITDTKKDVVAEAKNITGFYAKAVNDINTKLKKPPQEFTNI